MDEKLNDNKLEEIYLIHSAVIHFKLPIDQYIFLKNDKYNEWLNFLKNLGSSGVQAEVPNVDGTFFITFGKMNLHFINITK